MQKIRFATAIPVFSKKRGGAERYVADLCTRMAAEGYDVNVYAEYWDEAIQGIHYHPIKTVSLPKSLRLLTFALRATKEIEKNRYDLTLGVGNTLRADILQPHGGVHWAWFWRSLRAYDHPLVWMVKFLGRVFSPKQWVQGYIENSPYKKDHFHKIIAISEMVKEDILRWYEIPENRIEVVYNGVDTERFHPRNRRYREEIRNRHRIRDEIVILFVSNNFRMKGLGCLMKALAGIKMENPAFKLLVLGRGRAAPFLRLARRIGISEEIVFAGPTHEPEKYYGAADFFVHPAFYDAFSLTVLEALASGLPVIATATTGASRILDHGEEGFVVSQTKDLEQMKTAIRYFLNENVRRRASSLARMKAEKHSDEANFNQMNRIFRETIRTDLPKGKVPS